MSFQDLESGGLRRRYVNGKQDPTQGVASRLFRMKTAVSTFQDLVDTFATLVESTDHRDFRRKIRKTRLHVGQLANDTLPKLKQAIESIEANKKITATELAKDFHALLKEFQETLHLAAERDTASPPFSPYRFLLEAFLLGDSKEEILKEVALLEAARRECIAFAEEKEQGIQEIHRQIDEVDEIFKDLAELVHERGTMIGNRFSNLGFCHPDSTNHAYEYTLSPDDIGPKVEGSNAATAQGKSHLVKPQWSNYVTGFLVLLFMLLAFDR